MSELFTYDATIDKHELPYTPVMDLPFVPDKFQVDSFIAIENGKNLLVAAPTSSGKTLVAEWAIIYNLKKGNKVVYTSPIKTLSDQVYKNLKKKLQLLGFTVGLLTGDKKIDIDSDCLIVTAEILCNSLYKLKNHIKSDIHEIQTDFVSKIKCVVMDEIHFINDPDRGKVWEHSLILLDEGVQIVGLSATINKVNEFAKWMSSIKKTETVLVQTLKRVVPLKHYIFDGKNIHMICDENNDYHHSAYVSAKSVYDFNKKEREKSHKSLIDMTLIDTTIKYLKKNELLPCIFFSFSKQKCRTYATSVIEDLVTSDVAYKIRDEINNIMKKDIHEYEKIPQFIEMKDLLMKGVAYHHSGLLPRIKEIIEYLFENGYIKVLFATETFAVGVNMPTRTVIFTELSKFVKTQRRFLNTAEYKQMAGRAGRRGLDTNGTVLLLPLYNFPEESDLKDVMLSTMPSIISKFKIDYSLVLKMAHTTVTDIDKFFDNSLLSTENSKIINSIKSDHAQILNNVTKYEEKILLIPEKAKKEYARYYELTKIANKNVAFGNFALGMSKKDDKDFRTLKTSIEKDKDKKTQYDLYVSYHTNIASIKELESNALYFEDYLHIEKDKITNILVKSDFITKEGELTLKGIIASQINECNSLLLTEMIFSNIFDPLSPEEIVGLVSIFCNRAENEDDVKYKPSILTDQIKNVNSIIDKIRSYESEYQHFPDDAYWNFTTDYVELAYNWAKGADIAEIIHVLDEINEYEGNFVKNMLKIYNIVHDLVSISKELHKDELISKLEKIDTLILRGIVNVNSLFIQ